MVAVVAGSALKAAGSTRRWRKIRAAVLRRDGHRCRYCGAPATHVDHVDPRKRGGDDDPANLRAACAQCNLSKGGRGLAYAEPSFDW